MIPICKLHQHVKPGYSPEVMSDVKDAPKSLQQSMSESIDVSDLDEDDGDTNARL